MVRAHFYSVCLPTIDKKKITKVLQLFTGFFRRMQVVDLSGLRNRMLQQSLQVRIDAS